MLYTNGKIIIHKNNNIEELKNRLATVVQKMLEEKSISVHFEPVEDSPYPAYQVPPNVTYKDLEAILSPYISMKAINEDELVISSKEYINKIYHFSDEEMREIADQNMKHLKRKKEIELEKQSANKKFAVMLQEVETGIYETVDKHTNGYEYRDIPCIVKLNFLDGNKYFIDAVDPTICHKVEKLKNEEKQIRIDHVYEEPVQTELAKELLDSDIENDLF